MKIFHIALVSAVLAGPANAHHSFAMFDRGEGKQKTISGVVQELSLVNPHSWFKILVPGAEGRASSWSFEMGSVQNLDGRKIRHPRGTKWW